MSDSRAIQRIKLAVALLAAGLASFGLSWQPARAAQQIERVQAEIVGVETPAAERPGADDNPLFALHFLGDYHGTLEPCG